MKSPSFPDNSVFLCSGSKCGKHKDFRKHLKNALKNRGKADLEIFLMECTDRCRFAPVLCLQPHNIWYYQADETTVADLIRAIDQA